MGSQRYTAKLEAQLKNGQHLLFAQRLTEAEQVFAKVKHKVNHKQEKNDELIAITLQANLGLWAVSYFRNANQLNRYRKITGRKTPSDPNILTFLGNVFFSQSATCDEALEVYEALLGVDPVVAKRLVTLVPKMNCSESSLKFLVKLAEFLPDDRDVTNQLCSWYLQLGDLGKVKEIARNALSHDHKNRYAHQCLGYVEEQNENWGKSKAHYRNAGDNVSLLRMCIADEDYDTADEIAKSLLSKKGRRRDVLTLVGWLRFKQGKIEEAVNTWQESGIVSVQFGSSLSNWLKGVSHLPNDVQKAAKLLDQSTVGAPLADELKQTALCILENAQGHVSSIFGHLSSVGQVITAPLNFYILLQKGHVPKRSQYPRLRTREWKTLQAIYFAQQGKYRQALKHLPDKKKATRLYCKLLNAAVEDELKRKNHDSAVQLALDHHVAELSKPMMNVLLRSLWEAERYAQLIPLLLTQGNYLPQIHHQLAIAYMRVAIQQASFPVTDADHPLAEGRKKKRTRKHVTPSDLTLEQQVELAIGHWAIVLSDDNYLENWTQHRIAVAGNGTSEGAIEIVRTEVLEEVDRWLHERLGQAAFASKEDYMYLAGLLSIEIERAQAMRHIIQSAVTQKRNVPEPVRQLVSPTLLQSYGHRSAILELLGFMPELTLSYHEAKVVRQAFSDLNRPQVFIESGQYRMAINYLQTALQNKPSNTEIKDLLLYALQCEASECIENARWDSALEAAEMALELRDTDTELQALLARSAIGWSKNKLGESKSPEAVAKLKAVRAKLTFRDNELDAVLCDTLVQEAVVYYDDHKEEGQARRLLLDALAIMPDHVRAKGLLALIYHNQAVAALKANKAATARDYAKAALKYEEDPATSRILAVANAELQAWDQALQHAFKAFELDHSEQSLSLLIELRVKYAIALADKGQFAQAIEVVKPLLDLPNPPGMLDFDIKKFLSALHNDYGVQLIRIHRVWEAKQQWRNAVDLDPGNSTAWRNLALLGY